MKNTIEKLVRRSLKIAALFLCSALLLNAVAAQESSPPTTKSVAKKPAKKTNNNTTTKANAATEARLQGVLSSMFPGAKIDNLVPSPFPDMYQFEINQQPMYVDRQGNYIVVGDVIDIKNRNNVTAQRLAKLQEIDTALLPKELAVKIVRGNGERVLWTFEDPNCPYCKKLIHEMAGMTNVTTYVVMIPILSEDSKEKVSDIWCAPDKSKAFVDWMHDDIPPPARAAGCSAPTDDLLALAKKFRVEGTPALVFANGQRFPGFLAADRIEQMLSAASVVR